MGRMRLITILLPKEVINEIDILVGNGYFPTRSEAIRTAVYVMLNDIKRFLEHKYDKSPAESLKSILKQKH